MSLGGGGGGRQLAHRPSPAPHSHRKHNRRGSTPLPAREGGRVDVLFALQLSFHSHFHNATAALVPCFIYLYQRFLMFLFDFIYLYYLLFFFFFQQSIVIFSHVFLSLCAAHAHCLSGLFSC